MYEDILLPTDGSEGTTAATTHAAELASTCDATVHVLSVADSRNRFESPTSGIAPEAWNEEQRKQAEAAIDATVDALGDDVDVHRVLREGVPHQEIVEYVDAVDVDVVVMGTHGRTGLDHYLIGSVTEKVVRRSAAPVLSVRLAEE
jgi:nucleotide-binding universal stress UspA family protein